MTCPKCGSKVILEVGIRKYKCLFCKYKWEEGKKMIKIDKNLYIDADSNNLKLIEWEGNYDKKGKPSNQSILYFSTMKGLVNALIRQKVKESVRASNNLAELNSKIDKSIEFVNSVVSKMDSVDI